MRGFVGTIVLVIAALAIGVYIGWQVSEKPAALPQGADLTQACEQAANLAGNLSQAAENAPQACQEFKVINSSGDALASFKPC